MNRRFLILFVLAACAAPVERTPSRPLLTPEDRDSHIYRGPETKFILPERLVVRDSVSWRSTWARLAPVGFGGVPPAAVNFAREVVLVVSIGQLYSYGDWIAVDSVWVHTDTAWAVVRYSNGCGLGDALSTPADVVRVPAAGLPVVFLERSPVTSCGGRR